MSKSRLIILVLAIFLIAGTTTYAFASSSKDPTNPSVDITKSAAAAPSIASTYSNVKIKTVDSPDYVRASVYVLKSDGTYNWYWISNSVSTTTQLEIYDACVLGKLTQNSVNLYTDSNGYIIRATVY